jgi:hypothetical protein
MLSLYRIHDALPGHPISPFLRARRNCGCAADGANRHDKGQVETFEVKVIEAMCTRACAALEVVSVVPASFEEPITGMTGVPELGHRIGSAPTSA